MFSIILRKKIYQNSTSLTSQMSNIKSYERFTYNYIEREPNWEIMPQIRVGWNEMHYHRFSVYFLSEQTLVKCVIYSKTILILKFNALASLF